MNLLGLRGRICVIGNRGTIDGFNPRLLMAKRAAVKGVMLGHMTGQEKTEAAEFINRHLQNKQLNPVINKRYPLALVSKVHEEVINPPAGAFGKLVLTPWEE